jgi:2-polyprenyl-6-methoxyphenol hydroxylase-like FAD-dependent oxidoreductase
VLKQFSFLECSGGTPELVGVSRERLQQLLLEAAGSENVVMDATVAGLERADGRTAVKLVNGCSLTAQLVVGADGVRSVVARDLGLKEAQSVGQAGYRGIVEFTRTPPVQARTVCQARSAFASDRCSGRFGRTRACPAARHSTSPDCPPILSPDCPPILP